MSPSESGDRRTSLKARLLERLHDPLQLRIILIGVALLAGYVGVYMPLAGKLAATKSTLSRERKMAELAENLEQLQAQSGKFAKRLTQQADSQEWMQYVHEGIRQFPLKLCKLDCPSPKKIGPYPVIILTIELEGTLFDLDQFLRWLESNPRLMRTDEISIDLAKDNAKTNGRGKGKDKGDANRDDMLMKLTVLGLAG